MTLNAIFYVFAAVLYLAAAFGIYKTLQEPEPTEKFWIRPLICAGLMIADDYAVHLHVPAALGKLLL